MKFKTITIAALFIYVGLLTQLLLADSGTQIIKASSKQVDIKEDGVRKVNAWNICPEINPDVYNTSAERVTFYTDRDSISFNIEPDGIYDFIILLNEKDTARTQIAWVQSKLEILRQGEQYNENDDRFIPEFTYQSADSPDLAKLRKHFDLDSIAGDGSELSQIFNLMHWIHDVVPHDGSIDSPKSRNTIDMLKLCKKEKRGLNCRMMATMLNECYLAMGIKSRFITCMPKESEFQDCHVINMVFSTELDKWIWIDPSFEAYVMDEKGNLLGIEEVRERLVKGQPLILNADANWNRTSLQSKEYYLDYYMAKNLYRLEVPLDSKYNSETWHEGKVQSYVELLPLDGIEQTPQKREETNSEHSTKYTYYKTNNPDLFWAKPK